MEKVQCTIVIPTHSSYLDVYKNFNELFKINWADCKYEIILSVTGSPIELEGTNWIYNGSDATLPQCIYNVVEQYSSEYYLVLLGDAFVCNMVDSDVVSELISELKKNSIEYCSLRPRKSRYSISKCDKMIRYINYKDRYCHNFVAFIANREFIQTEFSERGVTDLDFELKYLDIANTNERKGCFQKHVVLTKDIMSIKPGIEKGKWNRDVHAFLGKNYPEINLTNRPLVSRKRQVLIRLISRFGWLMPDFVRKRIKSILTVCLGKRLFVTESD